LGVFPSTWEGLLSFFVPALSRFVFLSPASGDVDPPIPQLRYSSMTLNAQETLISMLMCAIKSLRWDQNTLWPMMGPQFAKL
jgi:hypothetical protein